MTANNAACPHCSGERPPHLVPRNYLCRICQERATDALGRTVRLFNDMKTVNGVITLAGNAARHDDDSRCLEVQERSLAYVDGVAYGVWEGRFGGVFLSPLPSAVTTEKETETVYPDCIQQAS